MVEGKWHGHSESSSDEEPPAKKPKGEKPEEKVEVISRVVTTPEAKVRKSSSSDSLAANAPTTDPRLVTATGNTPIQDTGMTPAMADMQLMDKQEPAAECGDEVAPTR